MKKFAFALLLAACGTKTQNKAEVMVTGQVPKASCGVKKVEMTFCQLPAEGSGAEPNYGVAVLGADFPFQWFDVKTTDQIKKAREAAEKARAEAVEAEKKKAEEAAAGSGSAKTK